MVTNYIYSRSSSTESAQLFVLGIVVGSARISVMFTGIHFAFFDFLLPVTHYVKLDLIYVKENNVKI